MVTCKACEMKGRGRRPRHVNGCEKGKCKDQNHYNKHYKQGYNYISYDELYAKLYAKKKVPLPPQLVKKHAGYKDGVRNKIKEVMANIANEGYPQNKKINPKLQPITNVFKPKGLSKLQSLTNTNKKNVNNFLKTPIHKDRINSMFKWVAYKFRNDIYKKPRSMTLYIKRNGSVNQKNEMFNVSDTRKYMEKVKKARKANKRFIITQLHLLFDMDDKNGKSPSNEGWVSTSGYHMNLLVHDIKKKQMYRFEPHGHSSDVTNHHLDHFLKKQLKLKKTKYLKNTNFLPFKGPMHYYSSSCFGSVMWCLAFMHFRLQYPNMNSKNIFKSLGLRKKSSRDFLTKYSKYIMREMKIKAVIKQKH